MMTMRERGESREEVSGGGEGRRKEEEESQAMAGSKER